MAVNKIYDNCHCYDDVKPVPDKGLTIPVLRIQFFKMWPRIIKISRHPLTYAILKNGSINHHSRTSTFSFI